VVGSGSYDDRKAKAVANFLRHLRERNASLHTIKAYSRDLSLFAALTPVRADGIRLTTLP
jgi:site-specific recombinase XerD